MPATILSDSPLQYDWDGEILTAQDFGPCTAHGGQHAWKYIQKVNGDKLRVQGDILGESCSEYDAL